MGTLLNGGVEQLTARQDHSLKITSSSLVSATRNNMHKNRLNERICYYARFV